MRVCWSRRETPMYSSEEPVPRGFLRVMQIIAAALLLGLTVFVTIALIVVAERNNAPAIAPVGDLPMITVIAVAMLAVQAPLAFIVPGIVTRNALRQIASGAWSVPPGANAEALHSDTAKLLLVRQTTLIIGLAFLEAAAFLGCI